AYGPEIIGVLAVQLRSISDALEVYSMFLEDLWRGLPDFQWRCSFLASAPQPAPPPPPPGAAARARPAPRHTPPGGRADPGAVAARVRTSTAAHLRSEVKSALHDLRDELPEQDRTLLVLRIDKRMEWRDIAVAMSDAELSDAEMTREAARLRKRLQLATE